MICHLTDQETVKRWVAAHDDWRIACSTPALITRFPFGCLVVIDPVLAPNTLEFRAPDGRVVGRIVNIGTS